MNGGAIFNSTDNGGGGTLSITDSTFSSNTGTSGGGIVNFNGTMTVTNNTFNGNGATSAGGGILNMAGSGRGRVTVTNNTFSGNSGGGFGGGIANYAAMTVTNSTFSGNSATDGGGIYNDAVSFGSVFLANSIMANSPSGGNCHLGSVIVDIGGNVDDGTTCIHSSTSSSLANTNPLLAPLANNGGPTQTMALRAGSPAIDYVLKCIRAGSTDQRGFPRPDNGEADCDSGAYESAFADTTLVTTPSQTAFPLGTSSPTLTDLATLAGGVNPTGTITFTLHAPGGTSVVDTETVAVNGNGNYTTPTGYTPPKSGTVTGTYQWTAAYSGDGNNNATSDQGGTAEQTTVSPAGPSITTTAGGTVPLGSGAKLTDSATLSGGYSPTGAITFRLFAPDGTTVVDTETVTVSGNGTYSTPTGYVPTVAGTYQWVAAYAGDGNNNVTSTNLGDEPEKAVNAPLATSLSVAAATGAFGGTTTLQATLTYGNGSGVGGKTIAFTLNGNAFAGNTATTNGSGVAILSNVSLAGINAGQYPTGGGASFAGDTTDAPSSASNSLTINPAPLTITAEDKTMTYGGTRPALDLDSHLRQR